MLEKPYQIKFQIIKSNFRLAGMKIACLNVFTANMLNWHLNP